MELQTPLTIYQFVEPKIGFITLGKLLSIKMSGQNSFHPNPNSTLTLTQNAPLPNFTPTQNVPSPKIHLNPNFNLTLTQNALSPQFDPNPKLTVTIIPS